ncbi:MAG TPA: 2-succinyl-5-enolpyruvyl-6-hydroxy-3-cyclohexene-1-carboxylic-acid synthase, partial [Chthonomonadales bacterium]|nr:2-succinyl-5-enolpyruvyl-6-hydroxy-3-cyclohexene-1-carboxylic-acid synthase [Chthonomonadales bacterium]
MMSASDQLQDRANPLYIYVNAFVDELQRAGVRHVVICPGSRSTPLAMACASQPGLRVWMHVDERSAAYFGLGMAKKLGKPVALLCTSGTAAANFLPAIVEAKLSHVPLLILTADRPHELRDNGAQQSIDQNRLYGSYVKWFVDVALPEATNEALRYIRTLANRAAGLACAVAAGPVHLNFPFREPLTPEPLTERELPASCDPIAWEGRPDNTPYVRVEDAPLAVPSPERLARLAELANTTTRGLIIVGPFDNPALVEPLVRLARRLGFPILADPLSQARCGGHDLEQVISSYDAFLRVDAFVERAAPELVLRFGAMPTSKPLLLYLKRYAACPLIVIDGHGTWEEPTQLAAEVIHSDPPAFCQNLLAALGDQHEQGEPPAVDGGTWLATWQRAERVTRQALQEAMQGFRQPFEGRVFTELARLLPDSATLYAGNSMPVRDLDTFFWSSKRRVRMMANRGANGIDGVVSSALGASAVSGEEEPTVLVIGDLSFFHDLNGLLAARLHRLNLTIVLVNNDGGGIFSFLPQAAYPEHFEQLFGTPTGLDFRPVVQMYQGHFQRVDNWEEFGEALLEGFSAGGLRVIEVPTER